MPRVTARATRQHLSVDRVVVEIRSVLNGRRREFPTLLGDKGASPIVVEHQDRFAWFGAQ